MARISNRLPKTCPDRLVGPKFAHVEAARSWWVYLLRCGDGSLYCGIALDVRERLLVHRSGRGARYTRGRGPLRLAASCVVGDKGDALSIEAHIKRLSRAHKDELVRRGALARRVAEQLSARTERRKLGQRCA